MTFCLRCLVMQPTRPVNTTTSFYHAVLGGATANGINSLLFGVYPDLQYDSWVTIGLEGVPNAAIGEAAIATVQSATNPWATIFDPGEVCRAATLPSMTALVVPGTR